MYWELQFVVENETEEKTTIVEEYNNFVAAVGRFNELIKEDVNAIIVYSHIEGYPISPVLAFANDWEQNFIHNPDWVV